jgi:hypothetical protein
MPILTPDLWTDADAWTDARVARLADAGRGALLEAAVPLRLRDAVKERRLAPEQGRRIVRRLIADAGALVRAATDALVAGALRLGPWFGAMRDALLPRHFAAGFAVLNNPDPPPADVAAIVAGSRRQVGYLERFRGQLADATQLLSGAAARADLYAAGLWGLSQNVGWAKAKRDGFSEARRQLGIADHCDECLYESSLGWIGIDEVTQIGDTICGSRCRCTIMTR